MGAVTGVHVEQGEGRRKVAGGRSPRSLHALAARQANGRGLELCSGHTRSVVLDGQAKAPVVEGPAADANLGIRRGVANRVLDELGEEVGDASLAQQFAGAGAHAASS